MPHECFACPSPSEQVFTQYKQKIYGYLSRRGIPYGDRDDVFGEVLLKAVQQSNRYDSEKASVSTWVYIITRSVVVDYFRRKKTELHIYAPQESLENIADEPDYESTLTDLSEQLAALPERERKIVISRFYYEMSYAEIARSMYLSEANVRQICSRSVKKLSKLIAI